MGYDCGIRVFDTAAASRTEPNFKKSTEEKPELRKTIFLVSKTITRTGTASREEAATASLG